MKLFIETLALDAMPWITFIYPELKKLTDIDWQWNVIEGVAAPVKCTKWCASMSPRLSEDGTTQYIEKLCELDKRVVHWKKEMWQGKVAMLNEPLRNLHENAILMQIDSDELWTAEQLKGIHALLDNNSKDNCLRFHCRYFVGPDIVITSKNGFGNDDRYEWHRAWRIQPGTRWESHEPPKLAGYTEQPISQNKTEVLGLVFDHYAYATRSQVEFKAKFYGSLNNKENGHRYTHSVKGWEALQQNTKWPVKDLSRYLPFVGAGITADKISK